MTVISEPRKKRKRSAKYCWPLMTSEYKVEYQDRPKKGFVIKNAKGDYLGNCRYVYPEKWKAQAYLDKVNRHERRNLHNS